MSGKGTVTVKTSRPKGWALKVDVNDTGIGIEKKIQKKLYTGFFSTKGSKGTGLGLPVTQKIVHEHKGELTFKTQVGKGTTFTLLLPEA
jgi:signal transduction histidine kinase